MKLIPLRPTLDYAEPLTNIQRALNKLTAQLAEGNLSSANYTALDIETQWSRVKVFIDLHMEIVLREEEKKLAKALKEDGHE